MPVLELPVVGVQAEFLNLGDDHAEGDKVFFYQHLLSNLQIIQKIDWWNMIKDIVRIKFTKFTPMFWCVSKEDGGKVTNFQL